MAESRDTGVMVMTEAYATSIAALVPVLMLAIALEAAWVASEHRKLEPESFRRAKRAVDALREDSTEAEVQEAERLKEVAMEEPVWESTFAWFLKGVLIGWALLLFALGYAEFYSLMWLADESPKADPELASNLMKIVMVAMAAISVMPLVRAFQHLNAAEFLDEKLARRKRAVERAQRRRARRLRRGR